MILRMFTKIRSSMEENINKVREAMRKNMKEVITKIRDEEYNN